MFIFSPFISVNLYNDPIIILFFKVVNKNVKINNYFSKIILIFGISDMVRVEKTQMKSKNSSALRCLLFIFAFWLLLKLTVLKHFQFTVLFASAVCPDVESDICGYEKNNKDN